MKKTVYVIFCFAAISYIFSVTAFANDFNDKAISTFQKLRKLNEEWTAAFMSGDNAAQSEKGKLLSDLEKKDFADVLKTLPDKYCAHPNVEVLREFMKTVISRSNSGDEYPTYVFAELYVCDTDEVTQEILSLTPDDQKVIVENLSYGFKNITYKIKSLPNYKELVKKLDDLKTQVQNNPC